MPWFPILLVAHIMLALSLLLPSLLLPFLLRGGYADGNQRPGPLAAPLLRLQGTGSVVIAIGLAITGAGLLAVLGPDLLRKPWLLAALGIYAVNLLVAGLVSRPNLRRLLGMREPRTPADAEAWRRGARRQRLLAYAMALATGVIGFLMSTKPEF
ncbi:MAG: DUF2269 family protein [Chloroflexi bacterium]|nr:MAG: DUF2269 family protein [Chloroflexota bacterium]